MFKANFKDKLVNIIFLIIKSCTRDMHLGLQILSSMNTKNQYFLNR
jgi:hypothetical protein